MVSEIGRGAGRQAAGAARFAAWWTASRRFAMALAGVTAALAGFGPMLARTLDGGTVVGLPAGFAATAFGLPLAFAVIAFLAVEGQAAIDRRHGVDED